MAERRMFAKTIIDSDAFLDMSITARLLYYDLSMRADDDGFVNSPKKIMRMIGASEDDLRMLVARKFIIPFEIGVVVIKHWKIHNYIAKDRYHETPYKEEKAMLELDENNAYREVSTTCIQAVDSPYTGCRQVVDTGKDRLGKDRLGKDRIDIQPTPKPQKHKYGEFNNVLLTDDELEKLKADFPDWEAKIENLSEAIARMGYKYKSHYLTIRKWAKDEKRKDSNKSQQQSSNKFNNFEQREYDYDALEVEMMKRLGQM